MEMMSKEEALEMVKVGDVEGDGALTQLEFYILMIRLSPQMMQDALSWLEMALCQELYRFLYYYTKSSCCTCIFTDFNYLDAGD